MGLRLNLDYALTLANAVGVWGGVDQRQLRAQIPKMNAVHAALLAAGDQGWPHTRALSGDPLERAGAWAEARRSAGDRVVVLGEPGAVAAARVLASGLAAQPRWVDAPDALEDALADGPAHLLVLDGPPWVRWLAASSAGRCSGLTVAGDEPTPLDGAELLPGPADARFGVLGPAALALALLGGADGQGVLDEARSVARRCAHPALFENPAYLWAALMVAGRESGLERLAFLLPTARLEPWAAWAARAWVSLTSRADTRSGVRVHGGVGAITARLGDEALIQHILAGPRDLLGCAVVVDDGGGASALAGERWALSRALLTAQVQQMSRVGRPVIQIRLPSLKPGMIAGLSVLVLHAALAVAIASDLDPLAAPAAAAWRALASGELPSLPPPEGMESIRG